MRSFEYDMTYSESTDSLTINFTVGIKDFAHIRNIAFLINDITIEDDNPICLYCDPQKSYYKVRASTSISFNDFVEIYNCSTPVIIRILLTDGTECFATYTKRKWVKECSEINRIIHTIIN